MLKVVRFLTPMIKIQSKYLILPLSYDAWIQKEKLNIPESDKWKYL